VSLATARVRRAREDLDDATLKAPYDGVVAERLIEPSQQVSAGQTVFRVQGRDGGLEVEVTVPETIVNRLEIGTEHRVIPQIGDKPALTGEIVEIASQASERNAFPVTLRLQQPPAELRSGTTAEVRLSLTHEAGPPAHQRIFEIPLTAYVPGGEGERAHVFRFIEERGVVELTPVTIVEVEDAGAHVSEGLSAGDIIAAKGVAFLRDGQSVTLLGEGPDRFNP
jgi:RND family efflux transporter MFP subunit